MYKRGQSPDEKRGLTEKKLIIEPKEDLAREAAEGDLRGAGQGVKHIE